EESGAPTYSLARWIFLRMLGLIYLAAFVSLWVQITGLIGDHGILPVRSTLETIHHQAEAQKMGVSLYHLVPTFCWLNASDNSLKWQCAAGTALALLVVAGVAPAPCLFLLWAIYLSLATVSREFLSFKWDYLLLEVGLLAIFFAPLQLWARFPAST